jgi:hypothetical protein
MRKSGKHGLAVVGFTILLAMGTPGVVASSAAAPGPPFSTTVPAAPPSCYPLSNKGNCYQPGQFCRNSDHGSSGVSANGERMICANNNGWRWEPA